MIRNEFSEIKRTDTNWVDQVINYCSVSGIYRNQGESHRGSDYSHKQPAYRQSMYPIYILRYYNANNPTPPLMVIIDMADSMDVV
jgi:hypothetical protein